MYRFKSGQVDVLVATDIVARGIDIDDIATVINFDVPHDCEDYVHRIGRTARAERDGKAITLVRGWEIRDFIKIEQFLEKTVEKVPLPNGMEGPEYRPMYKKTHRDVFHRHGHGNKSKSQGAKSRSDKPRKPRKKAKQ
jgi:superfamily II DNA/RNA helicase